MAGRFALPTGVDLSFRRRHYMRCIETWVGELPDPVNRTELADMAKVVAAAAAFAAKRERRGVRPLREHADSLLDTLVDIGAGLDCHGPYFDDDDPAAMADFNSIRRNLGLLVERCFHQLESPAPVRRERVVALARRVLDVVVLVLPEPDRDGYAEEFEAELLAITSRPDGSRRAQWAYTIRTAAYAVALRRSLLASRRQRVHGRE